MYDYEPICYDTPNDCNHPDELISRTLIGAGWVDPFGDQHPYESARDFWEETFLEECQCGWTREVGEYCYRVEVKKLPNAA